MEKKKKKKKEKLDLILAILAQIWIFHIFCSF